MDGRKLCPGEQTSAAVHTALNEVTGHVQHAPEDLRFGEEAANIRTRSIQRPIAQLLDHRARAVGEKRPQVFVVLPVSTGLILGYVPNGFKIHSLAFLSRLSPHFMGGWSPGSSLDTPSERNTGNACDVAVV